MALLIYSRNANDWTARLAEIAATAAQIEAKSFTVDGEAVVLGPDSLSRFEELSRREAADMAILYAFDLIEHDGEDMRDVHSSTARPRWRACCAAPMQGSCSTNTSPKTVLSSSRTPAGLGVEGIVSKRPVPRLDQGPQSGQPRCAAGEE
jgi:bifunctional non-homologous end joining protein LigD